MSRQREAHERAICAFWRLARCRCGGHQLQRPALLQKRVLELVRGQKPLFETRERNFIKIAAEEMKRGLIELVPEDEESQPQSL